MTEPNKKLAESLEVLKDVQGSNPVIVLNSTKQISRTHLGRLLKYGYLQEVLKGWYIPSSPGDAGDTTVWYTSYWYFIKGFLDNRLGVDNWCLNAELSLDLLSGCTTVPNQLIVRSPKGNNNTVKLLYGTSILILGMDLPKNVVTEKQYGLRIYSLEEGLASVSPTFFKTCEITAKACLGMLSTSEKILGVLLDNGATVKAGRIAGALRHIGKDRIADDIIKFMRASDYQVREENPYGSEEIEHMSYSGSPYSNRITMMWRNMRKTIIELFPTDKQVADIEGCLANVEENYKNDAYHSMSIEGYHVTEELIEKVRSGNWDPKGDDKDNKNALVARGYYDAFNEVKESIKKILNGSNAGAIADEDHQMWYMKLWGQFVGAGLLKSSDLVGYRNQPVYIKNSRHTPLNPDAVRDAMSTLFNLLKDEDSAAVRAVLGHFFFGYIHPYMDGNGRMSRFLMNSMFTSGGYGWVIIPLQRRDEYMKTLEIASIEENIRPFAGFLKELIETK